MRNEDAMKEFCTFMQHVASALHVSELQPSDSGLVSLSIDEDYVINIQYVAATGKMLIFMPFYDVSSLSVTVLRKILAANLFGEETGGGWFGLESEHETLVYHYVVDFGVTEEPDVDEFVGTLDRILQLVEVWRGYLAEAADSEEEAPAPPAEELASGEFLDYQIRP